MSLTLTFREATSQDVPPLLKLVRSAYRGESSRAGWTTEADLVADERIDEKMLLEKINHPTGCVLIAFDNSSPPSMIACCEVAKLDDTRSYFGLFAVDPARQAGGVGRQVLQRVEEHAKKEWESKIMEMWVIWTRVELLSWYERRGYVKTGKREEFPYKHLVNGGALRDDLYFEVLQKEL